jgi:hypothetical protein
MSILWRWVVEWWSGGVGLGWYGRRIRGAVWGSAMRVGGRRLVFCPLFCLEKGGSKGSFVRATCEAP